MFRFQSLFLASLLSCTFASEEFYGTYEPQTSVTDHGAVSFDQEIFETLLGFDDPASFTAAGRVYREGGNSKSYAQLMLLANLTFAITKGQVISGVDANGAPVSGTSLGDYPVGTGRIGFQYTTGDSQTAHSKCRVGGLPVEDQIRGGCLAEMGPNGTLPTITVSGRPTSPLQYMYDLETNNVNARTLKQFSHGADERFRPGDNLNAPYFEILGWFVTYYGTHDYGDRIVSAGLDGTSTSLTNGNINLAGYGFDAQSQIAKKGTAYINVMNYVLRELYDAIYDCQEDCSLTECNDDAVHALDEAVAFYVGNSRSVDEDGIGNFPYALAEKRCSNFATCSGEDPVSGLSRVNRELFVEFENMKKNLNGGRCQAAEEQIPIMASYLFIPVIQGTLRYAWVTSANTNPSEAAQAEGAIFAAAVLPAVHQCSPTAASTIYNNMRLNNGASRADFEEVKEAFESVYKCLEISCADVGGIVNQATGDYEDGAAPCSGHNAFRGSNRQRGSGISEEEEERRVGFAVILAFVILGVVAGACYCATRTDRNQKEYDGKADPEPEAAVEPTPEPAEEEPAPPVNIPAEP